MHRGLALVGPARMEKGKVREGTIHKAENPASPLGGGGGGCKEVLISLVINF